MKMKFMDSDLRARNFSTILTGRGLCSSYDKSHGAMTRHLANAFEGAFRRGALLINVMILILGVSPSFMLPMEMSFENVNLQTRLHDNSEAPTFTCVRVTKPSCTCSPATADADRGFEGGKESVASAIDS